MPEEIARKSHYKLDQAAPIARVHDLAAYDAIIVGAGTRFGRLSSQMANFLDQAGGLWMRGALHGKVGGAFTSTATQHGGQETTLFSIITNLLHFGMVVVGLDYGHAGQMTQGMSRNAALTSEQTEAFRLSGAKLRPTEIIAEYRQFAADPSLREYKSRYPQNSKSVPAGSNPSKRGLTIRGMFTHRTGLRARMRNPRSLGVGV